MKQINFSNLANIKNIPEHSRNCHKLSQPSSNLRLLGRKGEILQVIQDCHYIQIILIELLTSLHTAILITLLLSSYFITTNKFDHIGHCGLLALSKKQLNVLTNGISVNITIYLHSSSTSPWTGQTFTSSRLNSQPGMAKLYDVNRSQCVLRQQAAEVCVDYMRLLATRGDETCEELRQYARDSKRYCHQHLGLETNSLVQSYRSRQWWELNQRCICNEKVMEDPIPLVSNVFCGMGEEEYFQAWSKRYNRECYNKTTLQELKFLMGNTSGEANKIVSFVMEQAIQECHFQLWAAFGQTEMVAESLKKRLETFPRIGINSHTRKNLSDFADLCQKILQVKPQAPQILDSLDKFNPGLIKLPTPLHSKWWAIRLAKDEKSTFVDFVSFINMSLLNYWGHVVEDVSVLGAQIRDIASMRPVKISRCVLRGHYSHKTTDCRMFMAMSTTTKRMHVRNEGACYRCFGDHFMEECLTSLKCWKCKSDRHHTLLHFT